LKDWAGSEHGSDNAAANIATFMRAEVVIMPTSVRGERA
jgi:hypothetical protein